MKEQWISVEDRLPEKKEKPYQVVTIAVKKYEGLNYDNEGIKGVNQDWVVREYKDNFTHWVLLPKLPTT